MKEPLPGFSRGSSEYVTDAEWTDRLGSTQSASCFSVDAAVIAAREMIGMAFMLKLRWADCDYSTGSGDFLEKFFV